MFINKQNWLEVLEGKKILVPLNIPQLGFYLTLKRVFVGGLWKVIS